MNKLVLIDGNSLLNRGFYATPPMTTSSGKPVNAVFGFVNMLVKIINDIKPTYILVAFDRKEPTFRHLMFKDYKGTRKPMPDDLRPQVDTLKEVLDTMGIKRFEQSGIEADDIIGTVAKKMPVETIIITGDKDSFQLVDKTTSVYFTKKGISELEIYDIDNFKEKTGISPSEVIELKALMGDSSDNIPGVEGVGSVTALKLVQTYGKIDNLYDNVDELKGKLKERVVASKDTAFLSRELATINTNVDIPIKLEEMTYAFPFPEKVKGLFVELEFRNFLKKTELFESVPLSTPARLDSVNIITVEDKSIFTPDVKHKKIAVVIGENINFYDMVNEYVIKIKNGFFDSGIYYNEALDLLKTYFEDEEFEIAVYSKKDLMYELKNYSISLKAHVDDVSIEKYILDSTSSVELNDFFVSYGISENDAKAKFLYDKHIEFTEKLKSEGVYNLYTDIELPLVEILYDAEISGFKIDVDMLNVLSVDYNKRISDISAKIMEIAGEDFNLRSPKQLGDVLFGKLGLKGGKKNNSGYSTGAEVLEELEDSHEIVPLILEYRKLHKLSSTYIEGFKKLMDRDSHLVHTTFYQTMTTTGRLSSREPNLQNIPVRDAEGKELRKLFISSFENGKIVGADYSQIELRLLAHFSKSEELINAYKHGEDIHTLTASQVFGVKTEEVTKEMRSRSKAVNFGIIYGISDYGLSRQLKISVKSARQYIEKYFEMYPGVKAYMDSNVEMARKNGYVCTLFGRKRYIREINSPNYQQRSFGERAAMNMPLQGTAADIIKIAMIKVSNRIKSEKLKSKLILQVHDELLVDTAPDEVESVMKILKEEMESAVNLSVPLTVETECGTRWFDAK